MLGETPQVELDAFKGDELASQEPEVRRPSSLICGSSEMKDVIKRLSRNRFLRLGGLPTDRFSQMTIDKIPETEPPQEAT